LQPYGCGCVLFRDPGVGKYYKHDSPYTYFSSKELHLGEISLECSRAGAAAVALCATQRLFPLVRDGGFAGMLDNCRTAALKLCDDLRKDGRFVPAFAPELDIVVWAIRAESISRSSELTQRHFGESAVKNLHLALAELPARFFTTDNEPEMCEENILSLRSVLMKPTPNRLDVCMREMLGLKG